MTSPVVPRLLLSTAVAVALMAAILAAGGAGAEGSEVHPKVEFVEVEGATCLQSVLYDKDAQLSDFQAAEHHWLTERYPGYTVLQWKTKLTMATGQDPDAVPENVTVQQEAALLQAADGSSVEVCFDIKLTVPSPGPGESPAPR